MISRLLQMLVIGAYGVIVLRLTRAYGITIGLSVSFGLAAAQGLAAAGLLMFCGPDQVTWRNRAAGICLLWGRLLGSGSLTSIIVRSIAFSIGFAILIAATDRFGLLETGELKGGNESAGSTWLTWALVWLSTLGWLVLSAGWLLLVCSSIKKRSEPISILVMRNGVAGPLIFPPIAVVASMIARYTGYYGFSAAFVWVPLVVIFLPVIAIVLSMLIGELRGKSIRWN